MPKDALSHQHVWQFQAPVYKTGTCPIPGTGARNHVVFDRYYCQGCLQIEDRNPRLCGDSYSSPPPQGCVYGGTTDSY